MRSERSSAILNIFAACLIAMLVLVLASCGGGGGEASASSETPADPESSYEVPEFRDAVYDESSAQGNSEVLVDLSGVDEGYFALVCNSDAKTKLQVFKGDEVYTYDVVLGKEQIFPLQMGNGTYTIKVMKNIVDTKYSELYCCTAEVDMADMATDSSQVYTITSAKTSLTTRKRQKTYSRDTSRILTALSARARAYVSTMHRLRHRC